MNRLLLLLCGIPVVSNFGQGQIRFQTDLRPLVDAPVVWRGAYGPGPAFSAQLYLVGADSELIPLNPATTFRAAGAVGADTIADRYVNPVDVTVPNVPPGSDAALVMRVWRTSLGSYENSVGTCDFGQSAPFTITLGGGDLAPAPLLALKSFTLGHLECPHGPLRITEISLKNEQLVVIADQATPQTRLQTSTNLQTWIDLNVLSTPVTYLERSFKFSSQLSSGYYRLEER